MNSLRDTSADALGQAMADLAQRARKPAAQTPVTVSAADLTALMAAIEEADALLAELEKTKLPKLRRRVIEARTRLKRRTRCLEQAP